MSTSPVKQAVTTALAQVDREKIYQWINELSSPETRENALLELSKKRESVPDLAPMLWHSCGTIAALLQVRLWTTLTGQSPARWSMVFLCECGSKLDDDPLHTLS